MISRHFFLSFFSEIGNEKKKKNNASDTILYINSNIVVQRSIFQRSVSWYIISKQNRCVGRMVGNHIRNFMHTKYLLLIRCSTTLFKFNPFLFEGFIFRKFWYRISRIFISIFWFWNRFTQKWYEIWVRPIKRLIKFNLFQGFLNCFKLTTKHLRNQVL